MAYGGTINPILGTESGVSLLIGYRLVIATNAKAAIMNGYHMFACATGIDDITIISYA